LIFPIIFVIDRLWAILASRAQGGKGLINNTGNRDFQTIILFMETPELDKMSFAVAAWEKLLGRSVKVFLKRVKSGSER